MKKNCELRTWFLRYTSHPSVHWEEEEDVRGLVWEPLVLSLSLSKVVNSCRLCGKGEVRWGKGRLGGMDKAV